MSGITRRQWGKVYLAGASIVLTGALLFKYTTPDDEALIAKFSPEVRREYEKNKQKRQDEQKELMKIVQATSKSNEPIWRTGPIKSPWEIANGTKLDDNLLDRVRTQRDVKGTNEKEAHVPEKFHEETENGTDIVNANGNGNGNQPETESETPGKTRKNWRNFFW